MTDCIPKTSLNFHPAGRVDVEFDAPEISSDGGSLLLRQMDERIGLSEWFSDLLPDERDPSKTEHSRREQVRQRVYQIVMGYEDCNDADDLRHDKVLKIACDGSPADSDGLSSQPTLSRFENSVDMRTIVKLAKGFEDSYVNALPEDTTTVIMDIDGTADETHGNQQLSMFNGYYDQHMYFPLPIFDAEGQLITAILRPGKIHDSRGVKYVVGRIIQKIKARFPECLILVRGDSHFGIPRIIDTVERLNEELGGIDYLFGLNTNARLKRLGQAAMERAKDRYEETGQKARQFDDFRYKAGSWPHARHVVARAEYSALGENPRFVVTSLDEFPPDALYRGYCGRGQAENHIKDYMKALQADRLSCSTFVANFFRLLLFAAAYRLAFALREQAGEVADELGRKQFDTLRLRLLKVAAIVTQSARRILVRLPAVFPFRAVFRTLLRRLELPAPAT